MLLSALAGLAVYALGAGVLVWCSYADRAEGRRILAWRS